MVKVLMVKKSPAQIGYGILQREFGSTKPMMARDQWSKSFPSWKMIFRDTDDFSYHGKYHEDSLYDDIPMPKMDSYHA